MRRLGAALAGATLLIASGCGGGSGGTAKAKTFDVEGTLTLYQLGIGADNQSGVTCVGFSGYGDISEGTQAVVTNADGKSVGVGELGSGTRDANGFCVFPIHVTDIKSASGIYSIEVSHRGKTAFKRSDAQTIAISLGN